MLSSFPECFVDEWGQKWALSKVIKVETKIFASYLKAEFHILPVWNAPLTLL